MNRKQKFLLTLGATVAIMTGISTPVGAMHIMEGFLSPGFCILWGVLCIPFLIWGFFSIKKSLQKNRKVLILLAMAGAYAFVLSALKVPSVTGSSSHMTGTGLGAILFGPSAMSILGIIVLLFQAILLAHGGLTTLGANTFSMAIAGPFATYGVYKLLTKLRVHRYVAIVIAAFIGDLFTYVVTSFQLGLAFPDPSAGIGGAFLKFLSIFAVTQLPLALIEGLITLAVIIALESYAKPELNSLGYFKGGALNVRES